MANWQDHASFKEPPRTCLRCGCAFLPRRMVQIFCATTCRNAWHLEERHRLMAAGRAADSGGGRRGEGDVPGLE